MDYSFRLYITGRGTTRSAMAASNLRLLCEEHAPGHHEIEIVDASEQPNRAEAERILATPTVVRLEPRPELRVIGDLSDHARAAVLLGLPGDAGSSLEGPT